MNRLTAIYIQWNLCRMPTSVPTANLSLLESLSCN